MGLLVLRSWDAFHERGSRIASRGRHCRVRRTGCAPPFVAQHFDLPRTSPGRPGPTHGVDIAVAAFDLDQGRAVGFRCPLLAGEIEIREDDGQILSAGKEAYDIDVVRSHEAEPADRKACNAADPKARNVTELADAW